MLEIQILFGFGKGIDSPFQGHLHIRSRIPVRDREDIQVVDFLCVGRKEAKATENQSTVKLTG
jgi:hypothetical protein